VSLPKQAIEPNWQASTAQAAPREMNVSSGIPPVVSHTLRLSFDRQCQFSSYLAMLSIMLESASQQLSNFTETENCCNINSTAQDANPFQSEK
jgi:hypothetical protein